MSIKKNSGTVSRRAIIWNDFMGNYRKELANWLQSFELTICNHRTFLMSENEWLVKTFNQKKNSRNKYFYRIVIVSKSDPKLRCLHPACLRTQSDYLSKVLSTYRLNLMILNCFQSEVLHKLLHDPNS